jgi:hypothetical protein
MVKLIKVIILFIKKIKIKNDMYFNTVERKKMFGDEIFNVMKTATRSCVISIDKFSFTKWRVEFFIVAYDF